MYTVAKKPDTKVLSTSGINLRPIITLEDPYDGRAQIVEDDDGYTLYIANRVGTYNSTTKWCKEAVTALISHLKSTTKNAKNKNKSTEY